jgi:hypothetical protein
MNSRSALSYHLGWLCMFLAWLEWQWRIENTNEKQSLSVWTLRQVDEPTNWTGSPIIHHILLERRVCFVGSPCCEQSRFYRTCILYVAIYMTIKKIMCRVMRIISSVIWTVVNQSRCSLRWSAVSSSKHQNQRSKVGIATYATPFTYGTYWPVTQYLHILPGTGFSIRSISTLLYRGWIEM